MTADSDSIYHRIVAFAQMVVKSEVLVTLSAAVQKEVGGDPNSSPKKEIVFEDIVGVVVAHHRHNHGGSWFPCSLFQPGEPA